ncbi:MAG: VWA domain-containing protein [Burkholderiales bacterium]|nr:VWA domain-containing protein [Burkholderiales bacterium]
MNAALTWGAAWPLWLLLLLPLVWQATRRSRTNLSRAHLLTAGAVRSLALLLVVAALLQPVWSRTGTRVSVVYALDVSRSVADEFMQSAMRFADRAGREAQPALARFVVFGGDARLAASAEDVAKVAVSANRRGHGSDGPVYQGATDLERALDLALLGLDPAHVKRIVLFSDGNQTRGDVWRSVPRLQAEGVRVFVFPATPRAAGDAWVESVSMPDAVRRDEPTAMTVRVVAQRRSKARLRLSAGTEVLGVRALMLEPGSNEVSIPVRLRREGAVRLAAQLVAEGDTLPENDRLEQTLWVQPRPRVLYVESQADSAKYLRNALAREGLDVDVTAPEHVPTRAAALERYDGVVLSDVPAQAIEGAPMQALQSWVQERGGGLLFASGETTYGEKGYSGSVLEKILPVEFKSEEKRKDLALVLCIDRSYSMKGRPIALAKAGARAALALLEEQHYFGVIAFDSQPNEAVPLQYVRSKRRAEDLIDRIQASGQTNIYPALATAWRVLEKNTAKRKHVILLSDGDTAPADFERLLGRMNEARITVSTVTIGRSGDPQLMARIAELGKGRNYAAEDIEQVPQLFVQDTKDVSRTSLMEEAFRPVVKKRVAAVRGVEFAKAPLLLGYASVKAREGAEVFLATEDDAPILSRWQYGLGRTVMFASDVKNRWASGWLEWDGYGRFWAQLVRDTLRRDLAEQVSFQVERDGEEALIMLRAMNAQGQWRNGLAPRVRMRVPGGGARDLDLRQRAPGEYVASVPVATAGALPYDFELLPTGVGRDIAQRAGTRQLFYPYADEYRSFPPDLGLLAALTAQTGGKLAPTVAEIFADQGDRSLTRIALWPWLAAAALVCYLLDLALRRLPWIRRWFE